MMKFNFSLAGKVSLKFYKSLIQTNKAILNTLLQIKNFLTILPNFFSQLTNPQKLPIMKFNFGLASKVSLKFYKSLVQTNKTIYNTFLQIKNFLIILHNFFPQLTNPQK